MFCFSDRNAKPKAALRRDCIGIQFGWGLYWVGVFVTRSISLDNLDKEMIFTQGVCTRIYPGPDVLHSWGRNNSSKKSINIPNDIVIQICFNLVLS